MRNSEKWRCPEFCVHNSLVNYLVFIVQEINVKTIPASCMALLIWYGCPMPMSATPNIRGVLCTSKNTYYLFRWNEQNSNIPMYWFKGWTLWKNSILGAMEMIFVTVNIAMCPYRMKNAIKRTGLVFILIMSESKKPGQIAVVIHYCNLSRFFLTQTLSLGLDYSPPGSCV